MSNIMQMKDLRNKVHRDGFDLSRRVMMTAKVGEFLPVDYIYCVPGDKHKISLDAFTRTSPLQTAAMARLREYVDVYFVPYRLLWRHFDNWVLQGDNSTIAASWKTAAGESSYCPYTSIRSIREVLNSTAFSVPSEIADDTEITRANSAKKLLNYLGMDKPNVPDGNGFLDKAMNIWPLLAYQKIYQDYVRNGRWESPAPWTYNLDYMNTDSDMNLYMESNDYTDITSPFDLRYCNYNMDSFHGIMPSPQYGDESMVSAIINADSVPAWNNYFYKNNDESTFSTSDVTANSSSNHPNGDVQLFTNGSSETRIASAANLHQLRQSLNKLESSISVLSIRYAEMFQKWKEITMSSSDRSVKSMLDKHWNVKVSDYFSDRCDHIGGIAQNININEVVNTNLDSDASQANIHGKGTNRQYGEIEFETKDYGILMVTYHCKPIIEWELQDTFDKTLLNVEATDYPVPEFENIGMEAVRGFEFLTQAILYGDDEAVVGYAPRYWNYKTAYDKVKGDFQETLKSWCLPYYQRGDDVNYLSFKVRPSIVDNLFGVAVDDTVQTDHLRISCYIGCSTVRNLSRYGLPF